MSFGYGAATFTFLPSKSANSSENACNAILFIKGGKVVDKLVGAQPKSNFVKKIEQHI